MLGECAEFGARCIRFCMGAAARGTLSRPAARTPQVRHVAACLRPQAVRAASRSACQVVDLGNGLHVSQVQFIHADIVPVGKDRAEAHDDLAIGEHFNGIVEGGRAAGKRLGRQHRRHGRNDNLLELRSCLILRDDIIIVSQLKLYLLFSAGDC